MIFKPEMFQEVLEVKADKNWLMEYVAKTANTVLREHLLSATVVYCDKDELHFSGVDDFRTEYKCVDGVIYVKSNDEVGYTHKGYLIGVEEIKKECVKHEPVDFYVGPLTQDWIVKCKHCGIELQATWSEKK